MSIVGDAIPESTLGTLIGSGGNVGVGKKVTNSSLPGGVAGLVGNAVLNSLPRSHEKDLIYDLHGSYVPTGKEVFQSQWTTEYPLEVASVRIPLNGLVPSVPARNDDEKYDDTHLLHYLKKPIILEPCTPYEVSVEAEVMQAGSFLWAHNAAQLTHDARAAFLVGRAEGDAAAKTNLGNAYFDGDEATSRTFSSTSPALIPMSGGLPGAIYRFRYEFPTKFDTPSNFAKLMHKNIRISGGANSPQRTLATPLIVHSPNGKEVEVLRGWGVDRVQWNDAQSVYHKSLIEGEGGEKIKQFPAAEAQPTSAQSISFSGGLSESMSHVVAHSAKLAIPLMRFQPEWMKGIKVGYGVEALFDRTFHGDGVTKTGSKHRLSGKIHSQHRHTMFLHHAPNSNTVGQKRDEEKTIQSLVSLDHMKAGEYAKDVKQFNQIIEYKGSADPAGLGAGRPDFTLISGHDERERKHQIAVNVLRVNQFVEVARNAALNFKLSNDALSKSHLIVRFKRLPTKGGMSYYTKRDTAGVYNVAGGVSELKESGHNASGTFSMTGTKIVMGKQGDTPAP